MRALKSSLFATAGGKEPNIRPKTTLAGPKAKGDGKTDDTKALQACFEAIGNGSKTHTVYLPSGKCPGTRISTTTLTHNPPLR